ncbi:MAG: metal-dependent transcriptional regulator, partial [Pseudolysinimonas sp.]
HLEFTAEGRSRALHVMRKHRLAERLLFDVIGLDWTLVHDEACRWEHVMSEQVERRLLEILNHPTESPYGNPIPALEEIGGTASPAFLEGVVNIVERVRNEPDSVAVTIRRLGEPVQFEPDLLEQLKAAGVLPGAVASISAADGYVLVRVDGYGDGLELPPEVATHVYVARPAGIA